MSAWSARWAAWAGKFAALTRRERAIVAAALLFGGAFLIYSLAIEPFLLKARQAASAEAAARTELTQQDALLAMLKAQSSDPDAANRSRLAQARRDLAAVSQRLARFEAGMVPPERMQTFLEELLAKNRAIELVGLKTLPVTLIGAPAGAPKAAGGAGAAPATDSGKDKPAQGGAASGSEGIYQHGIEITLAGSYNDLLNYLAELERMPQRVMWYRVELKVEPKYPRNVMKLQLYTLSLDKDWLVV